jgi:hypothetical protein
MRSDILNHYLMSIVCARMIPFQAERCAPRTGESPGGERRVSCSQDDGTSRGNVRTVSGLYFTVLYVDAEHEVTR